MVETDASPRFGRRGAAPSRRERSCTRLEKDMTGDGLRRRCLSRDGSYDGQRGPTGVLYRRRGVAIVAIENGGLAGRKTESIFNITQDPGGRVWETRLGWERWPQDSGFDNGGCCAWAVPSCCQREFRGLEGVILQFFPLPAVPGGRRRPRRNSAGERRGKSPLPPGPIANQNRGIEKPLVSLTCSWFHELSLHC